jgi:hypothetical protein
MSKKAFCISLCVIFFLGFFTALSFAAVDIKGEWVGSTEVPDVGMDEFTLVFEKADGQYSGKMSDQLGMMDEVACEEIIVEDNKLTFHVEFDNGMEYVTVYLTFTITQDALEGSWEASGDMGEINFSRKK